MYPVSPILSDFPGELRVALVHDWLTGMRGGENVLEILAGLFPEAPIYTLFHFPGSVSPAIESHRIHTSFLQRFPRMRRAATGATCRSSRPPSRSSTSPATTWCVSSSHCVAKGVIPLAGRLPRLLLPHPHALRLGPGARLLPRPDRGRRRGCAGWSSPACGPGTSPRPRA